MQAEFSDSNVARSFQTFVQLYDMTFTVRRAQRLTLPAAPATELKHATPTGVGP
jgi:hypothetical protein